MINMRIWTRNKFCAAQCQTRGNAYEKVKCFSHLAQTTKPA